MEADILSLVTDIELPKSLEKPDRVIIGGGGIKRKTILKNILSRLNPGGIIVIPLVTIEAISELKEKLELSNCEVRITQNQSWRGIPLSNGTRFNPMNPVFIIKGKLVNN